MNHSPPLRGWRIAALTGAFAAGLALQAQEVFTPGFVKREIYSDLPGTTVDDLRFAEKYPGSPDEVGYAAGLETPPDVADNYGVRLSGFIIPPETGSYVFYMSSDDGGEFWLSTDATAANLSFLCYEPIWNGIRNWSTPGANATGRDPDFPENVSAPVTLTAGQRYYFEALMKEGGGGDNLAVTATRAGQPVPSTGSPPLWGSWVGVNIPSAGASVQVTQAPTDATVQANQNVTFTVAATGTSPHGNTLVYEWRRNGVPIPGAITPELNLTRVQSSDNGARYSVLVAVPGASTISSEATLTVTADTIPPTLVSASASSTFREVRVEFSEHLDPASATTAANYALSGGVTVSSATLLNPTTVRLVTSPMAESTQYTLTVNNVRDTFTPGNPIAAGSTLAFSSYAFHQGVVLNRFWDNFTANTIAALTNLASFPDNPDRVRLEKDFEYPPDGGAEGGANYGNLLEGWWTPPTSGSYVFFCSGDDPVNLYLSTDSDPANVKLIAMEPTWNNPRYWVGFDRRTEPENRSDIFSGTEWPDGNTITLQANQRYYVRALHTEGGGGDNVGVKAVLASAGDPENGSPPIPGSQVGIYYDPSLSSASIAQHPASASILEGRTATFTVGATGGWQWSDMPFYQWQSAPAGSSTFTDIAGATLTAYTTAAQPLANNGAQYRVRVFVPGVDLVSDAATLTVQADQQAPRITRVAASSPDALSVTFDEPLEAASANVPANYSLAPAGLTITSATLGGAGNNVVRLEVGGAITAGAAYTLTVNGVRDLYGNATANLAASFTARIVTYADIILQDGPIAFYRFEEATGTRTANLGTFGPDGDGLYMSGFGPDDSFETEARTAPGPRPPEFLGFASGNRAADFPGPDDPFWVTTQNPFLNGLSAFTLEYWVRPGGGRTEDPTLWQTRVGIVGQNDAIEYGFISPTTIQIWTPGGGALDTAYPYPDDEWHHVATIASGTDIRNYFDGVLVGTGGSATGNYGTSAFNVHIGGGGVFDATGNFFTGQIDEVAIFDKAIPAERILAHFRAGKEGGIIEDDPAEFTRAVAAGGNVTLEWTGGGTLQSAPTVLGPWTDVAGAASPYTTPANAPSAFYRIRN